MKKVAIVGANGQLGSDLVDVWGRAGYEVLALTHEDIRVDDVDSVRAGLASARGGVVLNTAAFHNVPKCEEDPARTFLVNSLGALNVAIAADDLGMRNVYFSTDYVFDGAKQAPYLEDDLPNPLNVYGVTKLAGEQFTLNYCKEGYVLRISGIYGKVPCRAKGGNFVFTMLRAAKERPEVRVVTDEVLTPTPTADIAVATKTIVERGAPGRYHATCEGECSWYEFAQAIFGTLKLSTPLIPAAPDGPAPSVKRPKYSVLENGFIKHQGLPGLPEWKDALESFLRQHFTA